MRAFFLLASPVLASSVLASACSRTSREPIQNDPSSKPLPSVSAEPPTKVTDTTRLRGDIDGRFTLRATRVTAFEPIVAHLDVRSTKGAIPIFVGGDQRNAAMYPLRIAIRATNAKGEVVCDSVAKPAVWSFGGIGGERTFAEGETFHETAVLNALCPALATPGDYKLFLHRRLAPGTLILKPLDGGVPRSCDIHPVHEGALPSGYEAGCVKMMDGLPSVTTELALHVDPFSAATLHSGSETALSGLKKEHDEVGRERVIAWLCGWVACACPTMTSPSATSLADAVVLGALPKVPPATFPRSCRGGTPP